MNSLKKYTLFAAATILAATSFVACKDKKEEEVTPEESFDKSGMLTNIGEQLILPAYAGLDLAVDSLQLTTNAFIAAPGTGTLSALQSAFLQSYMAYQSCSVFEFGPAENEFIRASFNTFPCDTLQINSKITAGDLTLDAASDLDVKGFPALDYLLFGSGSSALSRFTTAPDALNARNYLAALVNELQLKAGNVNTAWSSAGGNYLATFKENTGNDVGGSIGLLVNQLNFDLELLKNAKIGIPLGKKTLGVPQPDKAEALYSAKSLLLAAKHISNIESVYLGRNAAGADGLGLDDYVSHVGAEYGGGSLNDAIKNKFVSAKTKLALIPGTLEDAVVTNASIVDAAYVELQQLVILLKVDMPSSLGVSITYVDNDGD